MWSGAVAIVGSTPENHLLPRPDKEALTISVKDTHLQDYLKELKEGDVMGGDNTNP
jgi:hypothetical protein